MGVGRLYNNFLHSPSYHSCSVVQIVTRTGRSNPSRSAENRRICTTLYPKTLFSCVSGSVLTVVFEVQSGFRAQ